VRIYRGAVQFSPELRDRVTAGEITVSIRLWRTPKVKVGGRYPHQEVVLEVDAVELMPFGALTDDDLARSGERSLDDLRHRAAHAGLIEDDTLVYRVEFHVLDPR
jgi:hypothetical protein